MQDLGMGLGVLGLGCEEACGTFLLEGFSVISIGSV